MRDRNRTCIIRICNPLPNRSATHAHILAESIRFELMRRFLNDSLANCWFNHSPNSPYRNSLTELHRIVTLSSLQVLALVDICKFTVIKCSYTKSFKMAEAVRFELTEHFCSSVFKTGAINRTLPHFHIETHQAHKPRQSVARTFSILMCFYMAGALGIEPRLTSSKPVALPLRYAPTKWLYKFLKNIFWLK